MAKKPEVSQETQNTDTVQAEPKPAMAALRGKKYEGGNCGDDVATILAPISPEGVMEVGRRLGLDVEKYLALNPGQQRMNVANRIRGLLNKDVGNLVLEDLKKHAFTVASLFPKVTKAKAPVADPADKAKAA